MIIRKLSKIKELPASHEDQKNPGSFKKVIFQKQDFSEKLFPQMVNWARLPVAKSFRQHLHQDMIEIFIVNKGKCLMQIEREKKILTAGDSVLVPSGKVHKMTNVGKNDLEYFVLGLSKGENGKTIVKE